LVIGHNAISAFLTALHAHILDSCPDVNYEILLALDSIAAFGRSPYAVRNRSALLRSDVFTRIASHSVSEHEVIRDVRQRRLFSQRTRTRALPPRSPKT
jgi:hypothetical protein